MEWSQAGSFMVAYLMGRLSSSPLAGAATPKRDSYSALGGLVRMKDAPKDIVD